MSEADREQRIRRILVALDASPHSLAALRVAAELAKDLEAELLGLYVEDINLLRLAELPLAREVTIYSADPRQLSRRQIEQQLRSQARLARRSLASIAERHRLRWSFRVVQGVIPSELLVAAEESDLTLLGKAGWSRRKRLGSTARIIVAQAPNQIMIIQEGKHLGLPVGLIYDGSELAKKALLTATNLLRSRLGYLVVIILSETMEQARQFQSEISEWVRELDVHVHYRWLIRGGLNNLTQLIHSENCGVLVIPAYPEGLQGESLPDFVNRIDCPVLLVR